MPGNIVFKPIEANLTHNTDFIKKMNPYCTFIVGEKRFNSEICKHGGKHPHWNDAVTVPFTNESNVTVELMDKDRITKDDHIGTFTIDLPDLRSQGQSSKWYPLYYKNKPAGEILIEANVQGDDLFGEHVVKSGLVEEKVITMPVVEKEVTKTQQKPVMEAFKTYVEQRQTVEPHTFLKEVDVVETRPVDQVIEVFEARKVIKDVQYTDVVHVKKQIETIEPQVVTKEVEVMEPRVVTKTIQVIENVPVRKTVDVIESVPIMKEIEVFEPHTRTKQIEITEQVPVTKTVTVTEPVHLKKSVEFVEPVITTQTITKEIHPEVIVNEQITKSVGPATYIGEVRELSTKFSHITLTEQEKTKYLAISEKDRLKLSEEEQWKWCEARRLAGGSYYSQHIVTTKTVESSGNVSQSKTKTVESSSQSKKKTLIEDNKF